MKSVSKKCRIFIALAGLATLERSHSATVYQANDWYAYASNATSISNGETSTATLNYTNTSTAANASNTYLWSYFSATPVTLQDGFSLTLNAGISVDYTTASSATVPLRFGLFDSSSPRATTATGSGAEDYGADRIGSGATQGTIRNGWSGALTESVASGGSGSIYRRDASVTTAVYASTGTGVSSAGLTTSLTNQPFLDATQVSLVLTMARSGNDLTFSGNLGSGFFSGTYTDYFLSYSADFDAVGFFLGGTGTGNQATTSITLSDVTVTMVPEPSTYALALMGGIFWIILRRKRWAVL